MNFDRPIEDADDDSPDPVEAYCVHCRESIEMEAPVAVWTRRGMPATRGECPICGGTVFRMGKSWLHERIGDTEPHERIRLGRETVYLAFAPQDTDSAAYLAADLERVGVACWLHEASVNSENWAEGVHPALSACVRMIYLLTPAARDDPQVEAAWRYFRQKNKPVIVAQVGNIAPPDDLRRRPRFDLTGNYKAAFRQLLQALYDGK
ncbi:MAG: TIR domain-containing protein [Chloroflexota bacterium]